MPLEGMEPPSKEVLEKVWSEFGLNEQRVREAIEHLKDWIQLQPHLPKEIGTFNKHYVNSTTLFIKVDILLIA
jgi:inorganic pyrophosphatase